MKFKARQAMNSANGRCGIVGREADVRGGRRARARGFTLIELMVVVVIISLLAGVGIPSYVNSVRKSHRSEAKTALLDLAAREERYYTINNQYTIVALNLGYPNLPYNLDPKPYYVLSVALTANGYSIVATAQNDQVNDICGSYTLDNLGNQDNSFPVGTAAQVIAGCW